MLILPIKKQWFDMIVKGIKKEEYREIKPYYTTRFKNAGLLNEEDVSTLKPVMIALRNGYSRYDPTLVVTMRLMFGQGKKEWGAGDGNMYYILEIIQRHSIYVGNEEQYRFTEDGDYS